MKTWASRLRIAIGVALAAVGAALSIAGWAWPCHVSWHRASVDGKLAANSQAETRRDLFREFAVLPWNCVMLTDLYSTPQDEAFSSMTKAQTEADWSFAQLDASGVLAHRSFKSGYLFSSARNWRLGPIAISNSLRSLPGNTTHEMWRVEAPSWLLLILGLVITFLPVRAARNAWAARQLRRQGLCRACGYDWRGLDTCPECGKRRTG